MLAARLRSGGDSQNQTPSAPMLCAVPRRTSASGVAHRISACFAPNDAHDWYRLRLPRAVRALSPLGNGGPIPSPVVSLRGPESFSIRITIRAIPVGESFLVALPVGTLPRGDCSPVSRLVDTLPR